MSLDLIARVWNQSLTPPSIASEARRSYVHRVPSDHLLLFVLRQKLPMYENILIGGAMKY
jgi:hypothetical protein